MTSTSQPDDNGKKIIRFQFVDSAQCRVIHVDGAWGGIGPGRMINMSIFSERRPTPNWVDLDIGSSSGIAKESQRDVFDGVTREIEAHLVFSVATAQKLRDWLNTRISEIETVEEELRKSQKQ